jgi:alkaline phosphatase D
MLDTRIEGRDAQAPRGDTAAIERASRQLLGTSQEDWLLENLMDSTAAGKPWQILGQQVMFSPQSAARTATPNPDSWDGYRAARRRVLEATAAAGSKHLVVLTGDVHSSWAYDIADPYSGKHYDPASGSGSVGTEIITPAISSPTGFSADQTPRILAARPHLKYFSSEYRGYVVLDLTREQIQADWWSVPTVLERTTAERFEKGMVSAAEHPALHPASSPSSPIELEWVEKALRDGG